MESSIIISTDLCIRLDVRFKVGYSTTGVPNAPLQGLVEGGAEGSSTRPSLVEEAVVRVLQPGRYPIGHYLGNRASGTVQGYHICFKAKVGALSSGETHVAEGYYLG